MPARRSHNQHSSHEFTLDSDALARCENYSRAIQIHLSQGNYAAARSVVRRAEVELEGGNDGVKLSERPLCDLLPIRLANALEKSFNAVYVADLVRVNVDEMLVVPNIGFKSVNEILQALIRAIVGKTASAPERRQAQRDIEQEADEF